MLPTRDTTQHPLGGNQTEQIPLPQELHRAGGGGGRVRVTFSVSLGLVNYKGSLEVGVEVALGGNGCEDCDVCYGRNHCGGKRE